mmetsp:Transcript_25592/g.54648  ORF Transcript_25592/g.54648 Transcript_25592/m.54648 type:complete len:405 (+) Transcript_25592:871-2085(+)
MQGCCCFLEVLGSKDVLVVLSLAGVSCRDLHRHAVVQDVGTVQAVGVGWFQNGTLCGCQVVVHRGRPTASLVAEIAPSIDVGGGRKPIKGGPALFGTRPRLRSVHRPLAKENHVARLGGGLDDKFLVLFSVDHPPGHLEVRLVRAGHDAKASVAGVVVPQDDVAAQQGRTDRPVVAVVGQVRVVLAGGAIDGPPVQLEALRSHVLRQDHRQVVHPVALAEDPVEDRDEARVRQYRLEDARLGLSPLEAPAQVHPSGALPEKAGPLDGVAEVAVGSLDHLVGVVVDGVVGLGDLFRRQDASDDQVAVEVEEIPLVLRHFGGIVIHCVRVSVCCCRLGESGAIGGVPFRTEGGLEACGRAHGAATRSVGGSSSEDGIGEGGDRRRGTTRSGASTGGRRCKCESSGC